MFSYHPHMQIAHPLRVFFMFFCTVILTELSMFCVRLSHFIIKFEFEFELTCGMTCMCYRQVHCDLLG